jgi:hypothetical protein
MGVLVVDYKRRVGLDVVRTGLSADIDVRKSLIRPFHLSMRARRDESAERKAEHGSFFQNGLLLLNDQAATDTSERRVRLSAVRTC